MSNPAFPRETKNVGFSNDLPNQELFCMFSLLHI